MSENMAMFLFSVAMILLAAFLLWFGINANLIVEWLGW